MEPIVSGKLINRFKNIFRSIDNAFKKFDVVVNIKDKKLDKNDGSFMRIYELDSNGEKHTIGMKATPTNNTANSFDVYVIGDENKEDYSVEKVVKYDGIDDYVADRAESWWHLRANPEQIYDSEEDDDESKDESKETEEKSKEDVAASRKMIVGLKPIRGSREVQVSKIYANYDVNDATNDLELLVADLASLPEETVYEVESDPTGLTYQAIEEAPGTFDKGQLIHEMLCPMYALYMTLLPVSAEPISNTSCMIGNYSYMIESYIRQLCQLQYEFKGYIEPTAEYADDIASLLKQCDITCLVNKCIEVLDFYYPNFEHDIQKVLDDIIRQLKQALAFM